MGKKSTKKRKAAKRTFWTKSRQGGAVLALVLVSVAGLAAMAAMNGSAKPRRDMQSYVREGAVQVAAPAMEGAYDTAGYSTLEGRGDGPVTLPGATEVPAPAATVAPIAVPTREARPATASPTEAPTPAPYPTGDTDAAPVSITITAAGDCTLGGDTNNITSFKRFHNMVKKKGYDYFLDNFRPLFESDDLTIVNLEGPLTVSEDKKSDKRFNFRGDPGNVAILSGSGVEICNLANNHTLDYGKSGLKETCATLDKAGIGWCVGSHVCYTQVKGVRVGALGFTKWDHSLDDITRTVTEARRNCDLLIVSIHWGTELDYTAAAAQRQLGRAIIDAGADLVLGTHPHVVQGVERYRDRYIVYSLGNFCFGGNSNPADYRCLVFQQTFRFQPREGLTDEGINLIPALVSSNTKKNDFQPKALAAGQGAKLLKLVAQDSRGFSMADTVWMPDNYMVKAGLMAEDANFAAGASSDARTEDAPADDAAPEDAAVETLGAGT